MSSSEDLNSQVKIFLAEHTAIVDVGDQQSPAINARDLWAWLGIDTEYAKWFKRACRRWELVDGTDFVIDSPKTANQKGRGGDRRGVDHLVTPQTAHRLAADCTSAKGRAFIRAVLDVIEKIEAGDPVLAAYVVSKIKDPEVAGAIAEKSMQQAVKAWRQQGKDEEWIRGWCSVRLKGVLARIGFTGTLQAHGVQGAGFALATNAVYEGIFGKTASKLREEMGISKRETPRDHMVAADLSAVDFTEATAGRLIEKRDAKGNEQCAACTREVAEKVRLIRESV